MNMSELKFNMTKKEFENVEGNIATVVVGFDDVDAEEKELYDFMTHVSMVGRELGVAQIVTKKRDGSVWKKIDHCTRVRKVTAIDTGWKFELLLL